MIGTLRRIDRDWYIEHRYPLMDRPILVGVRWKILESRTTGPLAPELVDGLSVTYKGPNTPTWEAYKDGAYRVLTAQQSGEQLEAQPVPPPTVRKGTELRWYLGRWETYSKRDGWIRP